MQTCTLFGWFRMHPFARLCSWGFQFQLWVGTATSPAHCFERDGTKWYQVNIQHSTYVRSNMFPYGMDRVGSAPSCNSLPWVVMVSFGVHSVNKWSTATGWTMEHPKPPQTRICCPQHGDELSTPYIYIYENIGKYVFSAYTYVCISGVSITSTTSFIYMYI